MTMKTIFATALVALTLLSGAISAQAAGGYSGWAQQAFEDAKK
jgi:hypothetical protein